jgi:hypothetical protein
LVITFSDALYYYTGAIIDGADVKYDFLYQGNGSGTISGSITSAIYNATAHTITLSFNGVADSESIWTSFDYFNVAGNPYYGDHIYYDLNSNYWFRY